MAIRALADQQNGVVPHPNYNVAVSQLLVGKQNREIWSEAMQCAIHKVPFESDRAPAARRVPIMRQDKSGARARRSFVLTSCYLSRNRLQIARVGRVRLRADFDREVLIDALRLKHDITFAPFRFSGLLSHILKGAHLLTGKHDVFPADVD